MVENVTLLKCHLISLGRTNYGEVLAMQEQLFKDNTDAKLEGRPTINSLIICEHEPVFTLGKSGNSGNILLPQNLAAEFFQINRGGDVTFHGPGQVVAYPILDLDGLHLGVAKYVFKLEEAIILTLEQYGVKTERITDAAGIWIRDKKGDRKGDRKICAIGIQSSRGITMHGLAINLNTDLSWFDKIIACGLPGKSTTSLQRELDCEINMQEFEQRFIKKFEEVFGLSVTA